MSETPRFEIKRARAPVGVRGSRHMSPESEVTSEMVRNPIIETEDSVSYLGVRLPKAKVRDSRFIPNREQYSDYINDRFSLDLQKTMAVSFLQGDPLLVEGGTSIGKTTTARKMAAELGWEVHYANLNGATDVEDLMGRYIPNPNKHGEEDPEYIFADGKVTSGLRVEEGKRKLIILDEFNAAAPNIVIRLHEVLDALQRGENVVLAEDASESIAVDKHATTVLALMNPPGKGYFGREPLDPAQLRRWVYHKAPTDLPEDTFSHATDALFGLAPQTQEVPQVELLPSRDDILPAEQLQEIPGIREIQAKYKEFHTAMKRLVKVRHVAADQPQPFTFDDRMEPRRVRDFVQRFYNGDINETFQHALRYYYGNKLDSDVDKAKIEELLAHVEYTPPVTNTSQRRGLEREENNKKEWTTPEKRVPEIIRSSESVSHEEAYSIMGRDFLGPVSVHSLFDSKFLPDEKFLEIPFSRSELKLAKELGQMLILRVDETHTGERMTMENMQKLFQEKFDSERKGKVLSNPDWYKGEHFFTREVPGRGWVLVGKDVIYGSTNKNYLDQTAIIENYLKNQVFRAGGMPSEYVDAIGEFRSKIPSIVRSRSTDWEALARQLAELQLNKLTRQTPVEALYDMLLQCQSKSRAGKRLLVDKYTWTNERSSNGGLVSLGEFDSTGVVVNSREPGSSLSDLGVVFARKL